MHDDLTQYEEELGLADELREYADLDGCELGETCVALINLMGYPDYVSPVFRAALVAEVNAQLKNFKDYSTIVETVETPKPYTVRDLEWN